jgi:hypothetical protein
MISDLKLIHSNQLLLEERGAMVYSPLGIKKKERERVCVCEYQRSMFFVSMYQMFLGHKVSN